jgi:hypothetical protein
VEKGSANATAASSSTKRTGAADQGGGESWAPIPKGERCLAVSAGSAGERSPARPGPDKRQVPNREAPPERAENAAPEIDTWFDKCLGRATKWTRSLKPEWRGSGLLTRGPVDRNHSRPLLHQWTSYRSGRTERTLNPPATPIAGSNPAWSSMCLYPNGRGNASRARPVLVRVEPGIPFSSLVATLSIVGLSRDGVALLCIG